MESSCIKKGKCIYDFPDEFCVFDIETTNVKMKWEKVDIIEMAAIKVRNDQIVDEFQSLVALETQKENTARAINNISDEDLKTAPHFKDVIADFLDFIGDDVLVIHSNGNFDIHMTNVKAMQYNYFLSNNYYNLYTASRNLVPDLKSYSAEALANYFGIDYSRAHRALEDCKIELQIFNKLKGLIPPQELINSNKTKEHHLPTPHKDNSFLEFTKELGHDNPFYGKRCVISGTFDGLFGSKDRDTILDNLGCYEKARKDVSNRTDYFIIGDEPGPSKIHKALEYNVSILERKDFLDMLGYEEHVESSPSLSDAEEKKSSISVPNEKEKIYENITVSNTANLNFVTLYADIDQGIFSGKVKAYNAIKQISVSEYSNSQLISTYHWDISPSIKNDSLKYYLHEAWKEIDKIVFNKTVIMYDANFTVSTIIKTFDYLIDKAIPNTKPIQRCFPGLLQDLKRIRFDYICLSVLFRQLFYNAPNRLDDLCKLTGIKYRKNDKEISLVLGELLLYISRKTKCSDLIDLKHQAGITLGQVMTNLSIKLNKNNEPTEYDKYYYPCLPINDDDVFMKYNF